METQITSLHFKANNKLQGRIFEEAEKMGEVYDRIEDCRVILRLEKDSQRRNKVVEINVHVPGKHLFASDRSESFETAADLAFAEMKQQINKYKTAQQDIL